jgi:GxxExxY protein
MTKILYKEQAYLIIGRAMEVHKILGPGFLESVYQAALAHEFQLCSIHFEQQKRLPVTYKGTNVGDFIADFVVDEEIIVEIKAAHTLNPNHQAQALHYLAATGYRLAILINFGADSLDYKRIIR